MLELTDKLVKGLALRVLYRLRSLSEVQPLDAATFSYASPLLVYVVKTGGVGTLDSEVVLEQVSLSLDVIGFHCGESEFHSEERKMTDRPNSRRCGSCIPSAGAFAGLGTCYRKIFKTFQGCGIVTDRSRTSYPS